MTPMRSPRSADFVDGDVADLDLAVGNGCKQAHDLELERSDAHDAAHANGLAHARVGEVGVELVEESAVPASLEHVEDQFAFATIAVGTGPEMPSRIGSAISE